jgi:hypothetical protein
MSGNWILKYQRPEHRQKLGTVHESSNYESYGVERGDAKLH